MNQFDSNYGNNYTVHFDSSQIDFDINSRAQEGKKAETSAPII